MTSSAGAPTATIAAVDIGSNAARLLVRRDGADTVRRSEITRLAEGLSQEGRLRVDSLERTARVLRRYRTIIDESGAGALRVVATAAARTASNGQELLDVAEAALGRRPEVLSPQEEARLTFAGVVGRARHEGPSAERRLVVDIGGGSTELVVGIDEPERMVSLDIGSASLTEAELLSDPPRPEELSNAIAIVQEHVDDALRELPDLDDAVTIIGVGGTITTVAAVELGLAVPPGEDRNGDGHDRGVRDVVHPALHGFLLTRPASEDVFRTLAGERLSDRVHNPGLPRQRAPVIVGGCCILVGLLRRLRAPGLRVSVHDLLDGLLIERP